MPKTEQARKLMCAVCHGRAKPRKGRKLPNKQVACEQCSAEIEKSIRAEVERETPTKRFLMKFASNLSGNLPAYVVKDAMRKARGHAGGTGKVGVIIEKKVLSAADRKRLKESSFAIPERKAYPIPDEAHARNALARVAQHGSEEDKKRVRAAVRRKFPGIKVTMEKAAGILEKGVANYRKAAEQERQHGVVCIGCDFYVVEGDRRLCQIVEGDIGELDTCDLWKAGSIYSKSITEYLKGQPDAADVHVNHLLPNDDDSEEFIMCKFDSPEDVPEAVE